MHFTLGDITACAVILFIAVWASNQREVMEYPATVDFDAARPGEMGAISGIVNKVRGDCVAHPTIADTVLIDANKSGHVINQRTGLRLLLPKGQHTVTLQFEVPRLAVPGEATIQIHQTYECGAFRVRQSSPVYPYEVLADAGQ